MTGEELRAVLESAPAMIWSAGVDAKCDYVNAAWRAFTGRSTDQEIGEGWRQTVHPDDRLWYVKLVERSEAFETEVRLRRHDDVYHWVLARGAPRRLAEGERSGMVVTCFEIEHLRDDDTGPMAEFFELSVDHLCVAGFDGYWKRLNPWWTQTLGWTPEEMMSRPLIDFVHPDDREATLASREQIKEGEPLLTFCNRYQCKDGSYRWLEWRSVAVIHRELVYAVARDVTAEREAQRARRELSESLRATLNAIADGVIATDPDTRIVRMNPVAEKLTGWPLGEAVGRRLDEVLRIARADTDETAPKSRERVLHATPVADGSEHARLVARDGRDAQIVLSRAPLKDADGVIKGAVIVLRDMTAERKAKELQGRLQRQLMLADRMASVGTLAAGTAHEINNPLAYVILNLELIAEELRDSKDEDLATSLSDCAEMAAEARQGAERIRGIVRGLMTFSRTEEEKRSVVEIEPILERAIDVTWTEIRHRARLVRDYRATPRVEADASQLGQVITNLIVNAAQAMPEGDSANEMRVVTGTDSTGAAVLEVQDTGPGIPADVMHRIFDPFFTTKPIGIGTGLGLSVCHNVVQALGGVLTARNREGGGAAFRISLPAAAPPTDGAAPAANARISRSPPRRAAVLIVDDEPAIGVSLTRVLREHEVTAVTSAEQALELVLSGVHFDIILSDLMLPGMSGMDLYEELLRQRPRVAERLVFITGGAFTPKAQAFLERVPNERHHKPLDAPTIRRLVERATD